MADDTWRMVRAIPSMTPDGRPASIIVGMVKRDHRLEPALRIDDGPIALLPLDEVGGEVLAAIRKTLLEWYEREGR
jgi:hypothetical protein